MRGGEKETLSVFIPEEEMGTSDSDLFVPMIDEASGRQGGSSSGDGTTCTIQGGCTSGISFDKFACWTVP